LQHYNLIVIVITTTAMGHSKKANGGQNTKRKK